MQDLIQASHVPGIVYDSHLILTNVFGIIVVVVQSLSCVRLFVTAWTAAHQAFLSFTISWSLLKLSIE